MLFFYSMDFNGFFLNRIMEQFKKKVWDVIRFKMKQEAKMKRRYVNQEGLRKMALVCLLIRWTLFIFGWFDTLYV